MSADEINIKAWELAMEYVEWEKNKFESYSNRILLKIFDAFGEENYSARIQEIVDKYSPPDEHGEEKKKKVKEFVAKLLQVLDQVGREKGRLLMNYLIWNVKSLESMNISEKLPAFLEAEGVPPEKIQVLNEKLASRMGASTQKKSFEEKKRR